MIIYREFETKEKTMQEIMKDRIINDIVESLTNSFQTELKWEESGEIGSILN